MNPNDGVRIENTTISTMPSWIFVPLNERSTINVDMKYQLSIRSAMLRTIRCWLHQDINTGIFCMFVSNEDSYRELRVETNMMMCVVMVNGESHFHFRHNRSFVVIPYVDIDHCKGAWTVICRTTNERPPNIFFKCGSTHSLAHQRQQGSARQSQAGGRQDAFATCSINYLSSLAS